MNDIFIAGHHYQDESMIREADLVAGSYRLAIEAARSDARYPPFVNGDAALAHTIIQDDDKVDDLCMTIYRELLRAMLVDPLCIERASHLILVIKNWERIADQATNIAEEVLFILEGVNVKHAYLSSRAQACGRLRNGASMLSAW